MKKLLLLLLPLHFFGATPDCSYSYRLTNIPNEPTDGRASFLISGGAVATLPINNISSGCSAWAFSYDSSGLSALSIVFQSAPNIGGIPQVAGSFSTFAGTTVTGSNPSTATTSALYTATGYYPFLRISLASSTGTGGINITLNGWKSTAFLSSNSSGSGVTTVTNSDGTLTISPTTGNVIASLNLANTNTWTAPINVITSSTTNPMIAVGNPSGLNSFISFSGRSLIGYNGNTVLQGGGGHGITFAANNPTFGSGIVGGFDTSGNFGVGTSSTIASDLASIQANGTVTGSFYNSFTNCNSSASPAVCSSAAAGKVSIALLATSLIVNTTAVSANSEIFLQPYGTSPTNLNSLSPIVSAQSSGTSFTITLLAAPLTNALNLNYWVVN